MSQLTFSAALCLPYTKDLFGDKRSCLKSHPDSKPRIINENLVQVSVKKRTVKIQQPIHVGFSVLEASKLAMARFWYRTILPTFDESNVELLYSGKYVFQTLGLKYVFRLYT